MSSTVHFCSHKDKGIAEQTHSTCCTCVPVAERLLLTYSDAGLYLPFNQMGFTDKMFPNFAL